MRTTAPTGEPQTLTTTSFRVEKRAILPGKYPLRKHDDPGPFCRLDPTPPQVQQCGREVTGGSYFNQTFCLISHLFKESFDLTAL